MTNILGGYKELVRWSGCCVVLNGSNEAERGCDGGGEKSNQTHRTRTRGQKLIWCWFICGSKFVSFSSSTAAVQLSVFVFVCLVPFLVWWVDHKTKDSLSTIKCFEANVYFEVRGIFVIFRHFILCSYVYQHLEPAQARLMSIIITIKVPQCTEIFIRLHCEA